MPSSKQANAVNSNEDHYKPPYLDNISEVIFTPNPVMDSTSTTNDAQRIIDAIMETWRAPLLIALSNRSSVRFQSILRLASKNNINVPASMAREAEYCTVYSATNMLQSNIENGTMKNVEVIHKVHDEGR